MTFESEKTAAYWEANLAREKSIVHWWDHPLAQRLYRDLYRTTDADLGTRASHLLFGDVLQKRKLEKGISFACGVGWKEIDLVRRGIVDSFTLVELSPALCKEAKRLAEEHGVGNKIETVAEPFENFIGQKDSFDLVYWDAALHHMSDTRQAIKTSAGLLRTGGLFLTDDYVGPSYNQFGDELYDLADKLRSMLPAAWFEGEDAIPRTLGRYGIEEVLASDPTEAADSANILPAIRDLMPGAKVFRMGGIAYFLACREAFGKFIVGDPICEGLMRGLFSFERHSIGVRPEYSFQAMACWIK